MKTASECIPCFVQQAMETIRRVTPDASLHEKLLRRVCAEIVELDMAVTPVVMGGRIQRLVRELTGNTDPYLQIKRQFNDHAMKLYPALRERVSCCSDPFDLAVRLSIAGNRIDFGATGGTTEAEVAELLQIAETCPIHGSIDALREAVGRAKRILYLADNAGEIVFDRLLIEQMPREKVTLAVRGRPVLNDVTRDDAAAVGVTDIVEVIDNGSDLPGTVLENCSPTFRARFAEADLVISKGQGNYETLDHIADKAIAFLLMVKCPRIVDELGQAKGTFIVRTVNL